MAKKRYTVITEAEERRLLARVYRIILEAPVNDEELKAAYAESAEEDQQLAQLGLPHYAEILEQEDNDE